MSDALPADGFPHPHRGWSREIKTVRNAVISPDPLRNWTKCCGVFSGDEDIAEASIYRNVTRFFRPVQVRPEPQRVIAGRHVWGGFLFTHFGHFLCESTARLWAARMGNAESLIFSPRSVGVSEVPGYQKELFRLLGIDIPIVLVDEPTLVEELMIPGQGFGLGEIARATPEFRAMMSRMSAKIEPRGADKIFISRTKLGFPGRIIHEHIIEQNLAAQGYEIYHPQLYSVGDQMAQYKKATHIIGTDSSAFHLAGFVANPSQKIAVILRRNMDAYYNIVRQIEEYTGVAPDVVNVLLGDWMAPNQHRPNRLTVGELDHPALWRALTALGYVSHQDDWLLPSDKDFQKAVRHIQKKFGPGAVRRDVTEPVNLRLNGTL